jgi:acetyl esterase/lipase
MEDLAKAIASQGAVVFNIDEEYYGPFSKGIERMACAVRFARANAPDYGGDPSKIIAVGSSGGAYFALVVGLAGDDFQKEGCSASDGSALPYAMVGYEGPYDIATGDYGNLSHSSLEQTDPELWKKINPYTHVGKNPELKVRLIHGTSPDKTIYDVKLEVSTEMHQALVDEGYDAELHVVEDSPHSALNNPDDDAFILTVEQVMELANEM